MYMEPLQLDRADMMPPKSSTNTPSSPVKLALRMTRHSTIVSEALEETTLRFTLVKSKANRLRVA